MKTNIRNFVLTFTVIAILAVSAFAQVTKLPQGAVIGQNQQAAIQKPTPTPATSNAQFIVAPNTGKGGDQKIIVKIPAQELTGSIPGGVVLTNPNTGGTGLSQSAVDKAIADGIKKAGVAGANAGTTSGSEAAKTYVERNVTPTLNEHGEALYGKGGTAKEPKSDGVVSRVGAVEAEIYDTKDGSGNLLKAGLATTVNGIKTVMNSLADQVWWHWVLFAIVFGWLIWLTFSFIWKKSEVKTPTAPKKILSIVSSADDPNAPTAPAASPAPAAPTAPAASPAPAAPTAPAASPAPAAIVSNAKEYPLSKEGNELFRAICNKEQEKFGGDDKVEARNQLRIRIWRTKNAAQLSAIAKEFGVELEDLTPTPAKPKPVPRFRVVEQEEGDVETEVVPSPGEKADGKDKKTDK